VTVSKSEKSELVGCISNMKSSFSIPTFIIIRPEFVFMRR